MRNRKAFFRRGEWRSPNREFEVLLNSTLDLWIAETGGPPFGDADPERTAARTVAQRVGARVIFHIPANPKRSRAHFFDRRQFRLPF